MQHPRGDVLSRLGNTSNQNGHRLPRVEFVNRSGERVNPHNGKPYSRPGGDLPAHGNLKRHRNRGPRSRSGKSTLPVKTFGVMFGGLTPIHTNPTIDPPPRVCYNCWQHGHTKINCPRPAIAKMCNNCGRRGEDLTTCPRCRVAHTRYLAHIRGEVLPPNDLEELFPQGYNFEKNDSELAYDDNKTLDNGCDEVIQQLIAQNDRNRQMSNYYNEQETEEDPYKEPQVKYVETREYVKNPVSRYNQSPEYEENEEVRHRGHHEDYNHEERERSYDDRGREEYPRYRDRESSEDRSLEHSRRGNSTYADSDTDPVQEVLQLAKSISHLSSETQELIMKQVMAERKEKAKLRATQHRLDDDWP